MTTNRVYVKLRDKGTIFHDASQSVAVSGDAIVEVEKIGRVAEAIGAGILQVISSEEAKLILAKTEEEKAKVLAENSSNDVSKVVAELEEKHGKEIENLSDEYLKDISDLKAKLEDKEKTIKELADKVAALTTTNAELEEKLKPKAAAKK